MTENDPNDRDDYDPNEVGVDLSDTPVDDDLERPNEPDRPGRARSDVEERAGPIDVDEATPEAEAADTEASTEESTDDSGLFGRFRSDDDARQESADTSDEPADHRAVDTSDPDKEPGVLERAWAIVAPVARTAGEGVALIVAAVFALPIRGAHVFAKSVAPAFFGLIPFTDRVYRRLATWAVQRFHRKADGDVVGFVFTPSGIKLDSVAHLDREIEEGEEPKRSGWYPKSLDAGPWEEAADGRDLERWGKVPVAFFDAAGDQRATVAEARVAEAMDLGRGRPLLEDARLFVQNLTVNALPGQQGRGGGDPIADGGTLELDDQLLEIDAEGALSDYLVDISPEADYEGMQVSLRKVKETYREKTGSEKIDEAKRLGFLAGKATKQDMASYAVKLLFYAMLIVAIGYMGPPLINAIFGSGGAGGGGGVWGMI